MGDACIYMTVILCDDAWTYAHDIPCYLGTDAFESSKIKYSFISVYTILYIK